MTGRERDVVVTRKAGEGALRLIPMRAALGAALAGCGINAGPPARYGGYYGGYGGYDRFYGPRRYYGGGDGYYGRPSQPRTEDWTQERLRQPR